MTVRIGIIGAGRRGITHAKAAATISGASIVAVCDPDAARAESLAAAYGAQTYAGYRRMLDEAELDVAYITSPPPLHHEQALAALAHGCHVLIEKPITLDLNEAEEIGAAMEKAGKLVTICQQHRYSILADHAGEALAGRKVALIHSYLYRGFPDIKGNWNRSWGGGHIVENQIHPLDLCRYLIGDVENVYAQYADQVRHGAPDWDNWDAYSVTLRFENGAVGTVATTYALWNGIENSTSLDIVAEDLLLRWGWGRLQLIRPEGTEIVEAQGDPTANLNQAFLQAVQTGDLSRLRQNYADAMETLRLVLACNESAETGKVIHL